MSPSYGGGGEEQGRCCVQGSLPPPPVHHQGVCGAPPSPVVGQSTVCTSCTSLHLSAPPCTSVHLPAGCCSPCSLAQVSAPRRHRRPAAGVSQRPTTPGTPAPWWEVCTNPAPPWCTTSLNMVLSHGAGACTSQNKVQVLIMAQKQSTQGLWYLGAPCVGLDTHNCRNDRRKGHKLLDTLEI